MVQVTLAIVMLLWKDGSMFDSFSKNSSDDESQLSSNAEKKDDEGVSKASGFSDQEQPERSTPNINTIRPREANNVNMQSRMDGRTCNIKQKCVMNQTHGQLKRGWDTKILQSSGPPEKVGDEAIHKELGGRMKRAATTASSLEAELDSNNINRTQSMATLNEPNP
ncbi:hypothetical protein Tco_1240359 [Tanacetum coccineum]